MHSRSGERHGDSRTPWTAGLNSRAASWQGVVGPCRYDRWLYRWRISEIERRPAEELTIWPFDRVTATPMPDVRGPNDRCDRAARRNIVCAAAATTIHS